MQISRGTRVYDIARRQHGTVLKSATSGFPGHGITKYAVDLEDGRTVYVFPDEIIPAIAPRQSPAMGDSDGPEAAR